MALHFDAIIIGTGQSGPALAHRFAKAGKRVAIVERKRFGGTCVNNGCTPTKALIASARAAHVARRAADFGVVIDGAVRVDMRAVKARKDAIVERKRFGGTCVNNGCIPTKSLIASARAAHVARRAADFGVVIESPIQVDMKAVKARKDAIVKVSNEGVEQALREAQAISVHTGHARFIGSRQVAVNGDVLEAEQIFINVGGRADVPPVPGIGTVPYLTNSSMMEVDFLPQHLMILGGSYIGLEFGQMYRRFGSEVTIVQRNARLIPREDEDVSQAIREILENEGIQILTDADATQVAERGGKVAVSMTAGGGRTEVTGSHLLVATGRRPNTDDLGLDEAGVDTDERGYIEVDGQLRTNVPGIWAMGDCNGRGAFTHTSYNDFEIIEANLFGGEERRVEDRIMTYALFIDPPLGRAGMTETEVRKKGIKARVAKMPMADVGRAYERSETKGFMKIIVDAESKQLLGAALLGIEGDEIAQGLLDMMYAKAPYPVIRRAMHIHPTVYEMIPYMFDELEPLL